MYLVIFFRMYCAIVNVVCLDSLVELFLLLLQVVCMHHLSKQLPGFSNLPYQISGNADFLNWVDSVNPEHSVPECWDTESELSR